MISKELYNEEKSKKNPNLNIEKESNSQDIFKLSQKNILKEQKKHINETFNIIKEKKDETKLSNLKSNLQKLKKILDPITIIFKLKNKKYFLNLLLKAYNESKKKIFRVITPITYY